ncbi:hypothetical protein [Dyella caseinilytica]|uniref:Uncharacterized protein n=1 Tax=Dyella caseinilytica TaxID=1849581 RepID=A0ABX7GP06_9GAMM|nr:hypothetical protein [Dyella caseinilytica]QRN51960.1 hypothetical protein ISN74_10550 [Dyella caseinilytica]GGA03930.1 hypothetical protein GCM10011408_26910 [Dyella caseinilytica]
MDESHAAAVSAVLLGYSTLSETQRSVFMDQLNQFMFVSPQQQRRIADAWLRLCQSSADPSVQRIAESAATYLAGNKKGRKSTKK